LSDEIDPVAQKKNALVRFYHRDGHYYVIISHNTSVPMILGIGYWNAYVTYVMGVKKVKCTMPQGWSVGGVLISLSVAVSR